MLDGRAGQSRRRGHDRPALLPALPARRGRGRGHGAGGGVRRADRSANVRRPPLLRGGAGGGPPRPCREAPRCGWRRGRSTSSSPRSASPSRTRGSILASRRCAAAEDREALWQALADGEIETVATDHAPWRYADKNGARSRHHDHPARRRRSRRHAAHALVGGGGNGRLTRQRFVALTSANAARMLGLYPRKGTDRGRLGRRSRALGRARDAPRAGRGLCLEQRLLAVRRLAGHRLAAHDDQPR